MKIIRDGQVIAEGEEALERVAEYSGLAPETIKAMALDLFHRVNAAGGLNCTQERVIELWAAVQRTHGVPERSIEPPEMRRQ